MTSRNWKRQPKSLPDAFQHCVDHAKAKHHRSVEQIADLMGLVQAWRLYKYVAEGNMPTHHLRGFEHACGADFVTQYLAHAGHKLLIAIPTGRDIAAADIQVLQEITNTAVGAVIAFAAKNLTADEAMSAITEAMQGLAWHRANVEKHQQPELDLEGE